MAVSILSSDQKSRIVSLWNAGKATKSGLADMFGVSVRTIGRVLTEGSKNIVAKPVSVAKPAAKAPLSVADAKAALKAKATTVGGKAPVSKPVASVAPATKPVAKASPIQWLMGPNFINLIQDGKTYTADATHPAFAQARNVLMRVAIATSEADKQRLLEEALVAINVKRAVQKFMHGSVVIEGDSVSYKGMEIDNGLTQRILDAMKEGKNFKFLINFFENLMLNPSRRAVNELFGFLQHNDIELTEDGHFLAWKRVNANYKDMYTGRIDNTPGKVVEVPRNAVDEDSNRTCSAGLHVAAKSYLPHYGGGRGVIVQVKVHPRDVVSIPVDYDNAKMRTCRYEVLKDVTTGFSHY